MFVLIINLYNNLHYSRLMISKFQDNDEELDFQQRVKLISLSLKELKDKKNLSQSERLSNYDSILDIEGRIKIGETSLKSNLENIQKYNEQSSQEKDSSQEIQFSNKIIPEIPKLKRKAESFLFKDLQKKIKLFDKYENNIVQQCNIDNEKNITGDNDIKNNNRMRNNNKQIKQQNDMKQKKVPKKLNQLTQKINLKSKQIELLQENNISLLNRVQQTQKKNQQTRSIIKETIKNQLINICKIKKQSEFFQNKNSYILNQNKIYQIDSKIQEIKKNINDLKIKREKQKIKKSKYKEVQSDEGSNNIIEQDKDKKSYLNCLISKYESEITKLRNQKEKLKQKSIEQQNQRRLKNNITLKISENEDMILLKQYIIVQCVQFTSSIQYYQIFDLESLESKFLKLQRIQLNQQKKQKYFKQYEQVFQKSQVIQNSSVLKNESIHLYKYEFLLMIRQSAEGLNLRQLYEKYEGLNQNLMKYIIKKIILINLNIKCKYHILGQQIMMPDKIFVEKNQDPNLIAQIKLADFGLTQLYQIDRNYNIQNQNQYYYFPPQYFRYKYGDKITIWSIGILFYECIYGKKPFIYDRNQLADLEFKEQLNFPNKPNLSQAAKQFIKACLQINYIYRIDLHHSLKHIYFHQK